MVRISKIALIFALALWGLVGAQGNLLNWGETLESVAMVVSMATIEGRADVWQATSNPALIWAGALFITLSKLAAGVMCAVGVWRMWLARNGEAAAFNSAKAFALAGAAVALFMLFTGFVVFAESWYEFWRSPLGDPVLSAAFRYGGLIALIMIYVAQRDE